MPYSVSNPPKKTHTLSSKGRRQWVHVFNSALKSGASEQSAHQQAWAAVRNSKNRKDQKMKKKAEPGRGGVLVPPKDPSDPTIIPPGMVSSHIPFNSARFSRALADSEAGQYTTRSGAKPTLPTANYFFNILKSLFGNIAARTHANFRPPAPGGITFPPAGVPAKLTPGQNYSKPNVGVSSGKFLKSVQLPRHYNLKAEKPLIQKLPVRYDSSETIGRIGRALGLNSPPRKPLLWGGPGYKQPITKPYLSGKAPSGVAPMSSQAKPATKSLNKKSSALLKRAAVHGSVTRYLGHRKSASYDELVGYIRVCHTARRILEAAKGVS